MVFKANAIYLQKIISEIQLGYVFLRLGFGLIDFKERTAEIKGLLFDIFSYSITAKILIYQSTKTITLFNSLNNF